MTDSPTSEQPRERADAAIQRAAMSLGSTDEWTDQETMIADFEARFGALRARVAQLEAALCKISTACRKDTSLSPKDPLLEFVVGVVDAALTQPAELEFVAGWWGDHR